MKAEMVKTTNGDFVTMLIPETEEDIDKIKELEKSGKLQLYIDSFADMLASQNETDKALGFK